MSTETIELDLGLEKPGKLAERFYYVRESIGQFIALEKQHGGLIPQSTAARLLKVSPQRITQLIAADKITAVDVRDIDGEVMERGLVSLRSVREYARQAITAKGGRPKKTA